MNSTLRAIFDELLTAAASLERATAATRPLLVDAADDGNNSGFVLVVDNITRGGSGGESPRRAGSIRNRPFHLDDGLITVAINGWAHPPIAALTLLTNCLVCIVLLRREMRTPTNVLLVAMAVSDTLTAALPTPCFVRFYTLGSYADWVPYSWCYVYLLTTDYLPTVTHTASIWLTVALAAQRYMCVCRAGQSTGGGRHQQSRSARSWFSTVRSTLGLVAVVFVASFAAHCFRFGEYEYRPVRIPSLTFPTPSDRHAVGGPAAVRAVAPGLDDGAAGGVGVTPQSLTGRRTIVVGCRYDIAPFLVSHADVYFATYYWTRVVVIHLVPGFALVALNAGLIWTMRVAARRRKQLMQRGSVVAVTITAASTGNANEGGEGCGNGGVGGCGGAGERRRRRECRRLSESNATTMMLVAVVGLLLAVELPLAVLLVVMISTSSMTSVLPLASRLASRLPMLVVVILASSMTSLLTLSSRLASCLQSCSSS